MSTHLACHTCNEMTPSDKINHCDSCGLAFCDKHGVHLGPPDMIQKCFFCTRCMGEEDDDDIEGDESVVEAIIERQEHELLDEIEGDKQAIEYFSSEHIDEFGEKSRKRLEEMRKELK